MVLSPGSGHKYVERPIYIRQSRLSPGVSLFKGLALENVERPHPPRERSGVGVTCASGYACGVISQSRSETGSERSTATVSVSSSWGSTQQVTGSVLLKGKRLLTVPEGGSRAKPTLPSPMRDTGSERGRTLSIANQERPLVYVTTSDSLPPAAT